MKKALISLLAIFIVIAGQSQAIVTLGSALLQNPGTDVSLPVSVKGLNGIKGVTGIEFHISYNNTILVYDTTINFSALTPATQWFYGGNGTEYSTNWLEPGGNKVNIPDNTVLFNIVFHYPGGSDELIFDTTRSLLFDSAFNIITGVQFVNGQVTPSLGSGESRWNGTGPWNTSANWSNGIPGDSTNAIIETGEVTVLSYAVCKSITINAGTSVNLAPGFALTANRDYTNNGTMTMQSDTGGTGSLLVRGAVSGTGVNNFKCYLDFSSGNPHMVSSPVSGLTAAVFGSNIAEKYIESTATWMTMVSTDNLQNGFGYRISGSTPATVTFQGVFNTGDITCSNLSYSGSGLPESHGLNLLGNPYPSAIQWEQGNWNRANLEYAVYVWSGYKYVSWNGSIGALTDGIIPAMQGFFVKSNAANASVTIPAGARLHSTQPFYKTTDAISNVLSLRIENTTDVNHFDEAFVHILNGSTPGFDSNQDAWKLMGNNAYPQIYTNTPDQQMLSINTQPLAGLVSVPVEVKTGVAGSYKITFGNIDSFSPDQPLFFEDKTAAIVINIRNSSDFVFTSDGTTETGRFVLHFQEVGISEKTGTNFSAWSDGNRIQIESMTGLWHVDQLDIFNISGQRVFSTTNLDLPAAINTENLTKGLYIMRIKTTNGVYSQKLIVR